MQQKTTIRLLAFSIFFLAHWFFGNLYEEIVLAPNQLTNTYQALKDWQGYFTITNQIYYYVPFTQIAVFVVCYLYVRSKNPSEKMLLKKAAVFGILSIIVTFFIITQLNLKLFFGDLDRYSDQLFYYSVIWLIGNAIRLYLVGSCLFFSIQTFLLHNRIGQRDNDAVRE